jgi:predicted TIM-barrel fold metal-dependent hydrolase
MLNNPRIVDMHVHLLEQADTQAEMHLSGDINAHLAALDLRLAQHGIDRALVYLLDERALNTLAAIPARTVLALMVDFRRPTAAETVAKAKAAGIAGIKILTYEQEITPADYPALLRVAQEVERQHMFLTICATFGSKKMYAHDALAFASYLLQKGFSAPLILAHGGGSRAREALLLMDDAPNVYIDTSFTTTYWKGSTVINDLAHTIARFPDRCFFGSDTPYVPWAQARADAEPLIAQLPVAARQKLLHDNAAQFLRRVKP